MKRIFSMAALVALAAGGAATQASAAATVTTALDANSAYVWRGMTANKGFVLQPSVDVAANGFGVNVWANYDVADNDGNAERNKFSEVDLTGSYAFKMGAVDASVGIIAYTFPTTYPANNPPGVAKSISNTTELFAGLGYDLGAGFAISTKLYYDFDQVKDFYLTAGLGYTYSLNAKTTLGLNGTIGYAGAEFARFYNVDPTADAGFFNYLLTASAKYAMTDAFSVSANINYSDSLDHDVLKEANVKTNVFGGISLAYTF